LTAFSSFVGQAGLKVDQRGGSPQDPTQQPSIETELDIQYVSAVGAGNTNWIWNSQAWMYEFTQELQKAPSRPGVISMSYAWSELDQCSDTTGANCGALGVNATGYVQRTNAEFQKLGVMGVTITGASGDSGCHGRTDEDCFLNPYMYPDYPASSPFITSVGGTMLANGVAGPSKLPVCSGNGALAGQCATGGQEITSSTEYGSEISTGGGFAAFSDRPAWQADVVAKYLANGTVITDAGGKINGTSNYYFNFNGRGFPDVSALAHKYFIVVNGAPSPVDGTSCASPSFAGMVALINDHRAKAGRPAVGFLNPLLYQVAKEAPAAFNDITFGGNRCTEDGCSCLNGFQAGPGWDAATGLGTMNHAAFIKAMDAIDARREAKFKPKPVVA